LTQINSHFRGHELLRQATAIRNEDLKRGNVYVSNYLLPKGGISHCGTVQRGHRANPSIASRNKACTRGVDRFIESFCINPGRELDGSSVGGGEKRVGQRHNQMGQLPEAVEQTKT
jgi:hypothetical protein